MLAGGRVQGKQGEQKFANYPLAIPDVILPLSRAIGWVRQVGLSFPRIRGILFAISYENLNIASLNQI